MRILMLTCGNVWVKNHTDPACAKSWSGFVIVFAGVPVMWQSKLQTETALSTMEAEIIALAACMRELIPIIDMVQLLVVAVGRQTGVVNMKVSVHEDIRVHWCWPRHCHHNSHLKVSIKQSRQFGFGRRFRNGVSNL
jgi:hypothetical protein